MLNKPRQRLQKQTRIFLFKGVAMRIYACHITTWSGDEFVEWARNDRDIMKIMTMMKREFKEQTRQMTTCIYEVPRNKDGLIKILNSVTYGVETLRQELLNAQIKS